MDAYHDTQPLSRDFHMLKSPPHYNAYGMQGESLSTSQSASIYTQPTRVTQSAPVQPPNAVTAIVFSCAAFWLCCWPLGLVAFILAVLASSSSDYRSAVKQLRVANILSGVALMCGIILWITIIVLYLMIWREAEKAQDNINNAFNDINSDSDHDIIVG